MINAECPTNNAVWENFRNSIFCVYVYMYLFVSTFTYMCVTDATLVLWDWYFTEKHVKRIDKTVRQVESFNNIKQYLHCSLTLRWITVLADTSHDCFRIYFFKFIKTILPNSVGLSLPTHHLQTKHFELIVSAFIAKKKWKISKSLNTFSPNFVAF